MPDIDVALELISAPPLGRQPFELVERKGLGHPDSICDAVMECISVALSRAYLETAGRVLHHNIDKGLLAAGATIVRFGGGEVNAPMRLVVGDRATTICGERPIPVSDIVETVLGASAESGDSGQVGRGNRVHGLISFRRPMTMEAAAGKNPVSHVGKVYNLLAQQIAETIYSSLEAVEEVYVWLASEIGRPLDEPALVAAQAALARGARRSDVEKPIREIVSAELAGVGLFSGRLARGELSVC